MVLKSAPCVELDLVKFTTHLHAKTADLKQTGRIFKMTEVHDTINETTFIDEAFEIIKRRHHHDDGTTVTISPVEANQGIERKIIEDEHLWKIRTQQQKSDEAFQRSESIKQQIQPKQNVSEQAVQPKREKQVMASCNCGKLFEVSGSKKDGVQLTAFDSSGNAMGSYSVSGTSADVYGASGTSDESYGASGSQDQSYAASEGMNQGYGR